MISRTVFPQFGDKHKEYIQAAMRATVSVAEGAVRAGKTIDNIAAFASLIEKGTPDKIHLASGSTSANAKLNIGDANGFGLEYIFRGRCRWTKYKGNEALAIKSHGREYIVIFVGGSKADSYKKFRGNSYGMWIATEINLHHVDTIKEAFNRQLAAKLRRVFWDLNPTSPAHWIYTDWIDRFPEQFPDKYNYQHFTISDNATITPSRLEEIKRQYDPNSIWYRRDILGERCVAEGLVYQFFGEGNKTDDIPESGEYYISVDYGTMNPFSAGLWCVNGDKAVRIKEFYYNGRSAKVQKTDEDYCDNIDELSRGYSIRQVVVDPSAASFITALQRRGYNTRKADNDVINGIHRVADYLRGGNIKIHRSCKDAINEFGLYSWDDKATDSDTVIKDNDHAMDDIRYFCSTIMKYKVGKKEYNPILFK